MFNAQISAAILVVVNWPNHGPGVDVEQGTARARGSLTVAHAKRIARILVAMVVCKKYKYVIQTIPMIYVPIQYMQIRAATYRYIHIHTDTYIYVRKVPDLGVTYD